MKFLFLLLIVFFILNSANSADPKKEDLNTKRQKFIENAMRSIPPESQNQTLSPYFFVLSDDPQTDQLPLKSTKADVNISGVIADVKVTQIYKNEGKNTLEAIYIFPGSTRAAVYAMKMTIGPRTIEAIIKEKEQAKKEYKEAIEQGKTATLLEQLRPNVFQMTVGNILSKDEIKVELSYTELLIPEDSIYQFVYPTVVGPRYSNQPDSSKDPNETWVKNPYMHSGSEAPFTFEMDLTLNAGMPISEITSSSHKEIKAEYLSKEIAKVSFPPSKTAGNKDFILKYSLSGNSIQSGVLLYPGKEENFFLAMLEPPKKVDSKTIIPREYIFIVDVSGSMFGIPIDTTKKLMKELFSLLNSNDYLNVLLFAGNNTVLSPKSLPATSENIEKAINLLSQQQGGGGTELVPALKEALNLPKTEGLSRIIVISTDGYVAVEKEAFEIIKNNLNNANLFSFGIGTSVNRFLIEGLARAGQGEPLIIARGDESTNKATKFKEYISSPVLTEIKVTYEGFNAYDIEPPTIPDVFAKRPIIVFGKYKGTPKGKIIIKGSAQGAKYEKGFEINESLALEKNKALKYLWARQKIMNLADYNKIDPNDKVVKEITALGLKYNLLTDYTSFLAVDTVIRAKGEKVVTVKQPLPMPEGVSDNAVGGGMAVQSMRSKGYSRLGAMPVMAKMKQESSMDVGKTFIKLIGIKWDIKSTKGPLTKEELQNILSAIESKILTKINSLNDKSIKGNILIKLIIGKEGKFSKLDILKNNLTGAKGKDVIKIIQDELKNAVYITKNANTESEIEISIIN